MQTKVIALSEIRIENENYVDKLCLVNPAHIISAHRGLLTKPGPHVLGSERERELTQIYLYGGTRVFVNESIEEIANLITNLGRSEILDKE